MDELLKRIAVILEVPTLKDTDKLESFPQWDSLAVLSVIAMLDAQYGVNLQTSDFESISTLGDLWELVQSRQK